MSHLYPFHSISRSSSYQQWWCCIAMTRDSDLSHSFFRRLEGAGSRPMSWRSPNSEHWPGRRPIRKSLQLEEFGWLSLGCLRFFLGGSRTSQTWSNLACTIGMVLTRNAVLGAGASMFWQGTATNQVDVWAVKNHLHLIPNTCSFA